MDKKTIIISLVVSCLVILLTGGTYAYLSWSSSSEQNTTARNDSFRVSLLHVGV